MGSALYIALNDLKSVIEEKWNTGSTDAGYPPRVVKVWEEKTVGYGDARNPVILLKPETALERQHLVQNQSALEGSVFYRHSCVHRATQK